MHKKQLSGVLALLFALLAFWGLARSLRGSTQTEDGLVISALPVGKADALILQEAGNVIVIDAGEEEDGPFLLSELQRRGIERIDLLLVTHFDKDHVGGAAYLLDHMETGLVRMPDYEGSRVEYRMFLERLKGHPDAKRVTERHRLTLGGLQLTVYPAKDPFEIQNVKKEYDNDMSLVTSIAYGSRRFLLTGDIEKTRIRQMLSEDVDWKHDWLKMPHHGRCQEALGELLDAVRPEAAVICCSEEKYAEEKTMELLKEKNIAAWDTSRQTAVTVCDGERMEVRLD